MTPRPTPSTLAILLLGACLGCADRDGPAQLAEIPAPTGLEQLSLEVREQYAEYLAALNALRADLETPGADLARAYGLLGMWYDLYEYFETAEACYFNAEQLNPADPRWPYYRAHIYRRRGPVEKARAAFLRVLELAPRDVPAMTWLAETELADGRPDAAEPLFRAALVADPSCVRARLGLGRVALARNDYREAVRELEIALGAQPAATDIHYALGLAYRGVGDLARAESQLALGQLEKTERVPATLRDPLREELQSMRRDLMHKNRTAKRLLREGRFDEAVSTLRQLVVEDPETADWRINLALALHQSGQTGPAMREIEDAIQRFPNHAGPHFGRGVFRAAASDLVGAEQDYRAALAIDPDYLEAHFNLGRLLQQAGRYSDSLDSFSRAVDLDPANPLPRYWLAFGLQAAGRPVEARHRLEQDLTVVQDSGGHLSLLLARILATATVPEARSGEEAVRLASAGFAKRADLAHAETLAMAWAEQGRFDQAVAWQQAALAGARSAGAPDGTLAWVRLRLDLYRSRKPARTTWLDGEHPPAAIPVAAPSAANTTVEKPVRRD